MRTAVIQNKSLFDSGRIDPSYHLSESIKLKKQLLGSPYTLSIIGEKSEDVFLGNIFTRVFVKDAEHGIPYIAASDMTKASIDSGKFISKNQAKKLKRLMLDSGWILISCSGTLGNVVYTNDLFKNTFATHDLIRLIPDDKKMPSGFLYAYLASKYGYTLLTQSGFGGVVKHINPDHVANIPIPLFPESKQKEIHNLIVESANLRVDANRLLEEAIALFEKYIGKSEFSFNYQTKVLKMNERNLFSNRFDAQFAIAQEEIKKEKKVIEYISINSIASNIFVGNRAKRNYVEDGIPFLSSSNMMLFNPIRYAKQISKKSPNLDSLQVSKGDILISRSGTIGNTILVGNVLSGSAISEHALRLVIDSKKMVPEYVFCYLNTQQGKRLMECSAYGSVIITLNEDYVGNILLPILDETEMNQITDKIREYSRKIDEATIKENQAISLVEKEIESWQHL